LNSNGRLGQGDRFDRTNYPGEIEHTLPPIDLGSDFEVVKLSSAEQHSCALSRNGLVKCWGVNGAGRLGQGHQDTLGDDSAEMGAYLAPVDLSTESRVSDVSAGRYHSCALFENGGVKCWGGGSEGALGQGDFDDIGDEPNEMGANLPFVYLGEGRTAQSITTGNDLTCALLDTGDIKCWGRYGPLGQGDENNVNRPGDALLPVDLGGGRTALGLASGVRHTCALLDDLTIKCWGGNGYGQLGLGDEEHRGDDPDEMGDALPTVDLGAGRSAVAIMAGAFSSCAILDDTTLKCWGENWAGQLGQGDVNDRGDEPGEMGDALKPIALE